MMQYIILSRLFRRLLIHTSLKSSNDCICSKGRKCMSKSYNFYRSNHFIKYAVQKKRRTIAENTGTSVVMAGILSWLGLQVEEEKELTDEEKLVLAIKRGILCIQREQFDRAEDILHIALRMALETMNDNGITYIYDLLANVAVSKNELGKAETLFKETLRRILSRGMEKNDNAVVEISLKLAAIYDRTGRDELAEHGFQFCLETLDKKPDKDEDGRLLLGMCLDTFAKYLVSRGRLKEAQSYLIKSLGITEDERGINDVTTSVLQNDVGALLLMNGVKDLAEDYVLGAIALAKINEWKEDAASFYCNLGAVYLTGNTPNKENARKAFEMALKLARISENKEAEQKAKQSLDELSGKKK